ncbi:hypothetical protein [Pseudoduganella buxea]|uniref:Uncharacterized protein n=1 Tax=Pseudoduganella buxea TaxID=1949069 RepID=A0ABQ1LJW8_9BURK|nr:hypothetical protein GCM10011572_52230 [Pseudoduganella buxea]
MSIALIEQVTTALAQFTSATRLYELTLHGDDSGADLGSGGLLVEAFAADDIVHDTGARDIIALSTSAISTWCRCWGGKLRSTSALPTAAAPPSVATSPTRPCWAAKAAWRATACA